MYIHVRKTNVSDDVTVRSTNLADSFLDDAVQPLKIDFQRRLLNEQLLHLMSHWREKSREYAIGYIMG